MHEFLLFIKIKGTVLLEGKYFWFVCSPGTFETVSVPAPFLLSSPATPAQCWEGEKSSLPWDER